MKTEDKYIYPYREATLNNQGGDISKRWYISFYAWSDQRQKLIRKRLYKINDMPSLEQRMAFAKKSVYEINKLLLSGYHFGRSMTLEDSKVPVIPLGSSTVVKALEFALEIKWPDLRKKSQADYKNSLKVFIDFLSSEMLSGLLIRDIKKAHIVRYYDFMRLKMGYKSGNMYNKSGRLSSLFSILVDRDIMERNPFFGVKKPKLVTGEKNRAFSHSQVKELKSLIQKEEPLLWSFICFMAYGFLRPGEIRQLRVHDVDLKKERILVRGEVAKNKKSQYVYVSGDFLKVVKKQIHKRGEDDFVFSIGDPSIPLPPDYMNKTFKKILVDLGYQSFYTLYSWKHTGVVLFYEKSKDIKAVQMQCRHSDIQTTNIYLKSLGFSENKAVFEHSFHL